MSVIALSARLFLTLIRSPHFISKNVGKWSFLPHLTKFYQISKFAGVGAHHHNAQAERAIRTIMSIARTMMIHEKSQTKALVLVACPGMRDCCLGRTSR